MKLYESATTAHGVDVALLTLAIARLMLCGSGGSSTRYRMSGRHYLRFRAVADLGGQTWN